MTHHDLLSWCSLWRAQGVGSKTFFALLAAFSSPEAFFNASAAEIKEKLPHLPRLSREKLQTWQDFAGSGADDLSWQQNGEQRHIITWHDARYPPLLRTIADPPPLLYVLGDPDLLSSLQIAMVGSRNASEVALQTAQVFAAHLAREGLTVISGLAQGIDGAAHRGALQATGKTIAVVGTGLDRVYPAAHHQLAKQIAASGALVSEFPIGTPAKAAHFPRRNRIISGLALGVLVVEASLKSGSLITARTALEQGREVFAIPNSIHNPLARGCHSLIKQGAKLVENATDILEELREIAGGAVHLMQAQENEKGSGRANLAPENAKKGSGRANLPPENAKTGSGRAEVLPTDNLGASQLSLLRLMGHEIYSHDVLVERLKLTSEEISAMLSILEIDGYIISLGGGLFQRNPTIMIN